MRTDSLLKFLLFVIRTLQVLVDAECTHDGSLKHICKYEQWGWETLERRVLDTDRLVSITNLQVYKVPFLRVCTRAFSMGLT